MNFLAKMIPMYNRGAGCETAVGDRRDVLPVVHHASRWSLFILGGRNFLARVLTLFIPWRRGRNAVRRVIGRELPRVVLSVRCNNRIDVPVFDQPSGKEAYDWLKNQWNVILRGEKITPGKLDEYDLVFGIGSNCQVADFLRIHNLRKLSSPLDWTGGIEPANWFIHPGVYRDTRFNEKIDAICTNFSHWLCEKDLRSVTAYLLSDRVHHSVLNVRTKIRFIHLFPVSTSIELAYPEVSKKMTHRAARLINAINKSEKILICWITRTGTHRDVLDADVSDRDVRRAVRKLSKAFPGKQIEFVFFEHDGRLDRFEFDKIRVCHGAYRIRSNHFLFDPQYRAVHPYSPDVNNYVQPTHVLSECLGNVKLSELLDSWLAEEKDD